MLSSTVKALWPVKLSPLLGNIIFCIIDWKTCHMLSFKEYNQNFLIFTTIFPVRWHIFKIPCTLPMTILKAMNRLISIKQSPSSEANSHLAIWEIKQFLWNPVVHYYVYKHLPLGFTLCQSTQAHIITHCFPKTHFNVTDPTIWNKECHIVQTSKNFVYIVIKHEINYLREGKDDENMEPILLYLSKNTIWGSVEVTYGKANP